MCICEHLRLYCFLQENKKYKKVKEKIGEKEREKMGSARWGKEKRIGDTSVRKHRWGEGAKVSAFTLFHTQCKKLAKVFFLKEPHQSNDYKICYFSRK